MNENYEAVVFYPAIEISRKRGHAFVEGMVGTYIEGPDGKMRPALCGGHDTGIRSKKLAIGCVIPRPGFL